MAETSYPSSDIESGGEVNLANDWLKQAIYKEVSQGVKLRERKFGSPSDVTAKYSKPPLPARVVNKDKRKPSPSPCRNIGLDQLRECARSNSPFQSTRMSSLLVRRDSSTTYSRRRCRPVCSMRISELAVPTKRQCIDTWRNKATILPGQMVYRLKQQVMDQTPIVKISDAVNCFSQPSSVTSKKRPPRKINKEAMISRNKEETQYISAIFGHKIAQKLIRPVNAQLNSQLQNISSIISGEICDVLRDKTKLQIDVTIHERMVRETADKVTIWIANILEETSEKLLEEDLKVKKFHERASYVTDGDLITVIGTIMRQEAELEEQEGPALDILDDLVDNVVTVCQGADSDLEDIFEAASSLQKSEDGDNDISTADYLSVSSGNNDVTESKLKSPVQDSLNEYLDEPDKTLVDDEESLKNHLMKQLNEIIDTNVIDTLKSHDISEKNSDKFDKHMDLQSNMQANRSGSALLSLPDYKTGQMDIKLLVEEQEHERDQNSLEKERSPSDEALNQSDEAVSGSEKEAKFDETLVYENYNDLVEAKAQSDKTDENKEEDTVFLLADNQVRDNIDEQKFNINDEQITNTNEEHKSKTNEDQKSNKSAELPEDRDKKVQFSYDNFGGVTGVKQSIHSNEKISEKASVHMKHGINIGQSNNSLLRDVDEPWPEDLLLENLTKPGESVSKSVTSLGKILESDEINLLSPEETSSEKDQGFISNPHPESIEQFNNFGINYEDFLGEHDETNLNDKQSPALVDDFNGSDLNDVAEPQPQHDLSNIGIVSGETDEQYGPASVVNTNQEVTMTQTRDGTFGVLKLHSKENVDQEELTAQIKGRELEASLNQLKQEIKRMNIQNKSSEQSLVSVMLPKLQNHDKRLQAITSDREQSNSDISKLYTTLSECTKFPHPQKRKLTKIHQRPSRPGAMDAKKFDYRVHPSTAPSWIRRGRGQGDLGTCPRPRTYMGTGTDGMRERELEIRKRCKDLDKILMNLEKWKSWLEYITKYITSLKEIAESNKPTFLHTHKSVKSDRPKPARSIEKDAIWTKLNHRAKGSLKLYKNNETIKFKIPSRPASVKYCFSCGKKQIKRYSRSPTRK